MRGQRGNAPPAWGAETEADAVVRLKASARPGNYSLLALVKFCQPLAVSHFGKLPLFEESHLA